MLRFATAFDRPPVGGFSVLPRRFRLRRDPRSLPRLPTARTCFAELLLPTYPTAADLNKALHTILQDGNVGPFGLAWVTSRLWVKPVKDRSFLLHYSLDTNSDVYVGQRFKSAFQFDSLLNAGTFSVSSLDVIQSIHLLRITLLCRRMPLPAWFWIFLWIFSVTSPLLTWITYMLLIHFTGVQTLHLDQNFNLP